MYFIQPGDSFEKVVIGQTILHITESCIEILHHTECIDQHVVELYFASQEMYFGRSILDVALEASPVFVVLDYLSSCSSRAFNVGMKLFSL